MNYDSNKHVIEYIEGNKVKQFKVPKDDYNLKFDKMSYNDVLMYIKLTKEEQDKQSLKSKQKNDVIKYKPLKTAFAKTKDYFAQDIRLMSQAEKLKKIAEYLISDNIQELKELLSNDVFSDDPIIKSVMELLNHKGYTSDEIKDLMKRKDDVNLYTSEIKNCIVKDGNEYSFKNITFKNTLGDLLNLLKQVDILKRYTIYVPIANNSKIKFNNKQQGFKELSVLIFGEEGRKFNTKEGRQNSTFLTDNYYLPSDYNNNSSVFVLKERDNKGFELSNPKLPLFFYSSTNDIIYINIKILYYLLQFNESFKNNNYKFVIEKLKNDITSNVILIAGSAFDLDNILNSLDKDNNDTSTDYYKEYVDLISVTISKFFNKQFTPVVQVTSDAEPLYYSDINQDKLNVMDKDTVKDDLDDLGYPDDFDDLDKVAKGLGLFSFRKDTKETLQSLLGRIVKLESAISYQNEQIKQLKTGIKSINQALPSSIRKDVFGNYFSNSLEGNSDSSEDEQINQSQQVNGALNPDKVYPKITFSEFRKLYNKL